MSDERIAFLLIVVGLVVGVVLSVAAGLLLIAIGVLVLVWPRITRGQP